MTTPAPIDDAFDFLRSLLRDWGLEALAGNVTELLVQGVPKDVIPIKLRETPEYQERFAANLERQKAGLSLLTEAEFLAAETALKTVVRRYVGSGEYDVREWTDKWLSDDVSPQELADKMAAYSDNYLSQPQEFRDVWASQGLTLADAIKGVLDPDVTDRTLKRKMTAVGIAGEASRQFGVQNVSRFGRFEELARAGVTADQAREGFSAIAGREEREGLLASISGTGLSREEQESAELLGDAESGSKRRKVLDEERGRFNQNFLASERAFRGSSSGAY